MLQITSIAAVAVLFLQKKTRSHEKRKHQRHHRRKPPPHSPSCRQLRPNQRSRMPRRANHRQAPRRQGRACASHHDRRPQLPQTNVGTRLQPATPTPRVSPSKTNQAMPTCACASTVHNASSPASLSVSAPPTSPSAPSCSKRVSSAVPPLFKPTWHGSSSFTATTGTV